MPSEEDNARRLLGVEAGASSEDIKSAYRQAARRAHPDYGGTDGLFQAVQEAYEQLTAVHRRREPAPSGRTQRNDAESARPRPAPTPAAERSWHPGVVLGEPTEIRAATAERLHVARLGRDALVAHDIEGSAGRGASRRPYGVDHAVATSGMLVVVFDEAWLAGHYRSHRDAHGDWELFRERRLVGHLLPLLSRRAFAFVEDIGWEHSVAVFLAVHGDEVDVADVSPPKGITDIVPAEQIAGSVAEALQEAGGPATIETLAGLESRCGQPGSAGAWTADPGVAAEDLPRRPISNEGRGGRIIRGGLRTVAALSVAASVPLLLDAPTHWAPQQASIALFLPAAATLWILIALAVARAVERIRSLVDRSPVRVAPLNPAVGWWVVPATIVGLVTALALLAFGVSIPALPESASYADAWWSSGSRALDAAAIGVRLGVAAAVLAITAWAGWRAVHAFREVARWRNHITKSLRQGGQAQARLVFELRRDLDPACRAWAQTLCAHAPDSPLANWLTESHRPTS